MKCKLKFTESQREFKAAKLELGTNWTASNQNNQKCNNEQIMETSQSDITASTSFDEAVATQASFLSVYAREKALFDDWCKRHKARLRDHPELFSGDVTGTLQKLN